MMHNDYNILPYHGNHVAHTTVCGRIGSIVHNVISAVVMQQCLMETFESKMRVFVIINISYNIYFSIYYIHITHHTYINKLLNVC